MEITGVTLFPTSVPNEQSKHKALTLRSINVVHSIIRLRLWCFRLCDMDSYWSSKEVPPLVPYLSGSNGSDDGAHFSLLHFECEIFDDDRGRSGTFEIVWGILRRRRRFALLKLILYWKRFNNSYMNRESYCTRIALINDWKQHIVKFMPSLNSPYRWKML